MNKKLFFWITILVIFILFSGCERYNNNLKYGIVNGTNVNMRTEPSVNSKVLNQFLPEQIVKIKGRTDKKVSLNGDEFYWYKVTSQNKYGKSVNGWVYGKFIVSLSNDKDAKLKILNDLIIQDLKNKKNKLVYCKPLVKKKQFDNKDYFVFSFRAVDLGDSQVYDKVKVFRRKNNHYDYLTGGLGFDRSYKFYDFEGDNYTEIVTTNDYGIRVFCEKSSKTCFRFNIYDEYKNIGIDDISEIKEVKTRINKNASKERTLLVIDVYSKEGDEMKRLNYIWNEGSFKKVN